MDISVRDLSVPGALGAAGGGSWGQLARRHSRQSWQVVIPGGPGLVAGVLVAGVFAAGVFAAGVLEAGVLESGVLEARVLGAGVFVGGSWR